VTSTTTGLPDRYRPIDQVAPDEETATGVIRSWRARDRVLNRDVALRVHTPGGPAARDWITRALTAGGLATPALAMVYDAAEGTGGTEPGGAAYVVNEWIEGTRLSDRLTEGPLGEREARAVVRRLAEGVAEAHRVGLAVGGLTAEHVVLRPGGLVGLLSVPAATATETGDIAALGALLELCLTAGRPTPIASADLAALVRRARSTDATTGLSSAGAMVALLAERPRTGPQEAARPDGLTDSGWMRRIRDRRDLADAAEDPADGPVRLDPHTLPPVPARSMVRPLAARLTPAVDDEDDLDWETTFPDEDDADDEPAPTARRRLAVVGLPLLALAMIIAIGWWVGSNVLTVASSVDDNGGGSVPSAGGSSSSAPAASAAPSATPLSITTAAVFDPFGDGEPENDDDVPLTTDGDPATAWSTLNYRNSADFGNLKDGVGIVYDLGSEQSVAGVTLQTTKPGSTVQVRTGGTPDGDLDDFAVSATGTLSGTDDLAFDAPVSTRYVLVWVTGLVAQGSVFTADLAEVGIDAAG
jgi:hypothetical protein